MTKAQLEELKKYKERSLGTFHIGMDVGCDFAEMIKTRIEGIESLPDRLDGKEAEWSSPPYRTLF